MNDAQRDLLHALGFMYLKHGHPRRALTLILLAARYDPAHEGVLRTLCYTYLKNGMPDEALVMIERLQQLTGSAAMPRPLAVLRAHALHQQGNTHEAKRAFAVAVGLDEPTVTSAGNAADRTPFDAPLV